MGDGGIAGGEGAGHAEVPQPRALPLRPGAAHGGGGGGGWPPLVVKLDPYKPNLVGFF